jgi:hypothetical protein
MLAANVFLPGPGPMIPTVVRENVATVAVVTATVHLLASTGVGA